jgi:hypothetical protein
VTRDNHDRLAALAALRAMRTAHRLAPQQAEIDRMKARITSLRAPLSAAPMDLAEAAIQDRHASWRQGQIVVLTERLARAEAAAQPLREEQARDRAREQILTKLARRKGRGDQVD